MDALLCLSSTAPRWDIHRLALEIHKNTCFLAEKQIHTKYTAKYTHCHLSQDPPSPMQVIAFFLYMYL